MDLLIGVITGLGAATLILGVVVISSKRDQSPKKYASLPLLSFVLVFVPLAFLDIGIEEALDALQRFVNYPSDIVKVFESYSPDCETLGEKCTYCETERARAIQDARAYSLPSVDNLNDAVDGYKSYTYGFGALAAGLGIAVVAFTYLGQKTAGRIAGGATSVIIPVEALVFVALGLLLYYVCDEYVDLEKLPSDARWFVDASVENDASSRPWVVDMDTFLKDCDAPPEVRRALQPGALEKEYEDLRRALCEHIADASVAAGALLQAGVLAWFLAIYFSKNDSSSVSRIGKLVF